MGAGVRSQSIAGSVASTGKGLPPSLRHADFAALLWVEQDGDFRLADLNAAAGTLLGLTGERLVGTPIAALAGDHARARRDLIRAAGHDEPVVRVLPRALPDGRVRRLRVVFAPAGPGRAVTLVDELPDDDAGDGLADGSASRDRQLVAAANEGVWLVDRGGRTAFANGRVARMLGLSMEHVLRTRMVDFVDEADRAVVAAALECPRDTPEAFEVAFRDCQGRRLPCLLSVSEMPAGGHGAPATLCVLADMTSLQRERELRLNVERRFRTMVETASEGVWTGDRDGRTTFANAAAARMVGLRAEEVVGRPFGDFVADQAAAEAVRAELARGRGPVRGEFRLARAGGGHVDVIASLSLLRDDDGEVVGSLALVTDVSDLRRQQADLRESRERFVQVFEEAPVGMVFVAAGRLARGHILGANRAFVDLLGYDEFDLLERDLPAITHPDDAEREAGLMRDIFETGASEYSLDKRFIRADGRPVWTRFRVHVLRDDNGTPLYGLGVAVDVTSQKEAVTAGATAQARAAALMGAAADALLEVAADGAVVDANDAALSLFGVGREELAGSRPEWMSQLPARAGEAIELTLQRGDGSELPARVAYAEIEGSEHGHRIVCVRNVGPLKRAVAARDRARDRFERLFRDAQAAAVVVDMSGRFVDVNPAFCALAGRAREELVGHGADAILRDNGEGTPAPWAASPARPTTLSLPRRIERPDGRSVTVQVSCSLVDDQDGQRQQWVCQCMPHLLADGGSLPDGEPLSYRERQVLGLLARGLDGPAIAERLGLSPETVRSYANGARERLGAKTRTEAVALALVRREITL